MQPSLPQINTRSPLRLYLLSLGFVLLVLTLLRLVFRFAVIGDVPLANHDALHAFYIGFRFDARIAALITLPLGAVYSIPPLARRLHRCKKAVTAIAAGVFFLLFTIYAVDFGFYAYLGVRLNSVLFDLLIDTRVALEMVWQSYPVPAITAGVLAAAALCTLAARRLAAIPVEPSPRRGLRVLGWLAGFLIFALAIYGQISTNWFPLRWSHAYFTTDSRLIALGLNPVQNLYDTSLAHTKGSYNLKRARAAYPRMAAFLGVDKPDPETMTYLRSIPAKDHPHPNIVIIIMESLAFPKTSFAPGRDDPTPHLKALAADSVLFTNYYANARTTARAVFSTITGIPDENQDGTGSRNPYVVDQRVVGNEFAGYDKYYMIGGNTSWANIRAVLAHNIDGLDIMEEGAWKGPNVDVWGISDLDLFTEANGVFAARKGDKPFLAVIQTASFHKPYTIPPTPGFSLKPLSEETKHNYGFIGEEEYNSLRYADFSVNAFLNMAKASPYGENTVFFIFGDHGLNDKSHNMPAGYDACDLAPWHVPMLIHAPEKLARQLGLKPGTVIDTPCGHVDIFPTAAGLAGIPYRNWTLGRDLFDPRFDGDRAVFIGGKGTEPMHLVTRDYCYYDNRLTKRSLHGLRDTDPEDRSAVLPDLFNSMRQRAGDIDETVKYMLFNNKRPK